MSIIDKYLEIESNKELYQHIFSYKNVLMYPFIRHFLLQRTIENVQGLPPGYDPLHVSAIQKAKYAIKSFWYRLPKKIQSNIVFFGSDISNIRIGESYFNRLTESFANEYPTETVLIELSDKMDYKRPRTYPKVFTNDFLNVVAKIKSKLTPVNSKDIEQIDSFMQLLRQNFNYEFSNNEVWYNIKNMLIDFSKKLPFLFDEYVKLLKNLSPKVIFLEDACYGGRNIPLILAAKELKIPVGEYQHGLISLSHPAYNYSDKLSDCYKWYMPDFYMSYGKYWMENSRIPLKIIELGNPYLFDVISQCGKTIKKEQMLYISEAQTPEYYVKEVIWLNRNLADIGCSVIFRIHPSETSRLQTVYRPIIDAGIQIDMQPLYDTLKCTKYIVGDFSTVLFEAVSFDCFIFVRDTSSNRENIDISHFNNIQSLEELVENIKLKKYKKTEPIDFWADNWRIKYHNLIDNNMF